MRIFVADSSRIYTRLLSDALARDPDLDVFPFESARSELIPTALAQNVDVFVISTQLDEHAGSGFEVLRELRTVRPDSRGVFLMDSSKEEAVLQAFRAGARGVFHKDQPLELLNKCVRSVYQGQVWADKDHLDLVFQAFANAPSIRAANAEGLSLLSERELQVVRYLAEGLTNNEIADRLHLSKHTIKNYLFRVFDKLGVSNRVELLFMTLSRSSGKQIPVHGKTNQGYSDAETELIEKSAEAGLPAAQLALAQMYLARRRDPQDIVDAYMWYLVAIECASNAKDFITRMMTPQQLEEAKRKADAWLVGKHIRKTLA